MSEAFFVLLKSSTLYVHMTKSTRAAVDKNALLKFQVLHSVQDVTSQFMTELFSKSEDDFTITPVYAVPSARNH